jgi:hypothetical protein
MQQYHFRIIMTSLAGPQFIQSLDVIKRLKPSGPPNVGNKNVLCGFSQVRKRGSWMYILKRPRQNGDERFLGHVVGKRGLASHCP